MAFEEHNITAISEIPALVEAFATTVGWDVATGPVIRHPDYEGGGPGGLAFTLSVSVAGLNHDLIWTNGANSARIRSPILATEGAPTVGVAQLPTKVSLVSMLTPQPYLAIIVEYGTNVYRHLYLGFMEKIGDYAGGEVISGCGGIDTPYNGSNFWWRPFSNAFLFGASQTIRSKAQSGGVHVDHLDNATAWRSFRLAGADPSSNFDTSTFDGSEAIGGYSDNINDHYVAKGKSSIAGASLLVPVNLMISQKPTGSLTRLVPIGHPAGVRMINLENLDSATMITIGGETWRVFAATRRSAETVMNRPGGTGTRYRLAESSHYLGYAYRSA